MPPLLSTTRLEVRPWAEADAQAYYELTQDEGFNAHQISIYRQPHREGAATWIREARELHQKTGLGKWAVYETSFGALIGLGGLTPWVWEGENLIDITYRFRGSAWGRGYGTELAGGLLQYGFELLRLPEITATIVPENEASKKIVQKFGMRYEKRILLYGVQTDLFRLSGTEYLRPPL